MPIITSRYFHGLLLLLPASTFPRWVSDWGEGPSQKAGLGTLSSGGARAACPCQRAARRPPLEARTELW